MSTQGPAAAPAETEGLWRRAFGVALLLTLLTELGVRWLAPSVWAGSRCTEAFSRPLLQDRVRALAGSKPSVIVLGDSVLYGSALREKGEARWRDQTPVAALRPSLAARGLALHSFAADGLEAMDQEALLASAQGLQPAAWVLELNPRIFAAEAGAWPGCLARPFLAPDLPPGSGAPALDWESRAGDALRRGWATYRYMELAAGLAWQPSLKDSLGSMAAKLFPPSAPDADLQDSLLDLKLRPYYMAPRHGAQHLGWQSLQRVAQALRASGKPALVYLTPQDLERVDAYLDKAAFAENRKELARLFKGGKILYRDWAERVPGQGKFLDHCHLDAAGNQVMADWIFQELTHAL